MDDGDRVDSQSSNQLYLEGCSFERGTYVDPRLIALEIRGLLQFFVSIFQDIEEREELVHAVLFWLSENSRIHRTPVKLLLVTLSSTRHVVVPRL